MQFVIPTMRIVASDPTEQGPFVIINADDFDADTQTEYSAPDAPAAPVEAPEPDPTEAMTKAEICAELASMAVDFDTRSTKAELLALLIEARAIRAA